MAGCVFPAYLDTGATCAIGVYRYVLEYKLPLYPLLSLL